MSFRPTAIHGAVREGARAFGEARIRPVAGDSLTGERRPRDSLGTAAGLDSVAPNAPGADRGAGIVTDHPVERVRCAVGGTGIDDGTSRIETTASSEYL